MASFSQKDIEDQLKLLNAGLVRNPEDAEVHPYSRQPDGDLIEDKGSGVVDSFEGQLQVEETYTSDWFDTDGWAHIEVFINASVPTLLGGVEVEYTDDVQATTPEVLGVDSNSYTNEDVDRGFKVIDFPTELDGARVKITNNGEVANDINVITTLRKFPSPDSAGYVGRNIAGNKFVRVGTNAEEDGVRISNPTSLFGDMETIERQTLVDLSSSFGTSTVRDEITSVGSGSITEDPDNDTGEIELSTGTTPDSSITVDSAEYGRYTPGYSAQQGVGIRIPSFPTEGEIRWGYFDDDNGFYWGYDADQGELFIANRKGGGMENRVYESNWNGRDRETVYARETDPAGEGAIFQIDFSWYGYGIVNFQVVDQTTDTISGRTPLQETVTLHSLVVREDTTTADPNQPIRVEAENGANGENVQFRFGGRQFSIFGQESKEKRTTSQTRFDVSIADGAWTHILTWQRSGVQGIDANARLSFDNLDLGVNEAMKFALVVNADVTGTTFNPPELTDSDETLLEVSEAGTFNGIGNGTKVWGGSVQAPETGNAATEKNPEVNVSLGQNNRISLIGFGLSGAGLALATTRFTEDW